MSNRPLFEARDFYSIQPPMAGATGTAPGVVVLASGTGAVLVDLTTVPGCRLNAALTPGNDAYNPNATGHFLFVQATGADVYFVFGPSIASVSAGNAPSSSAVSTVDASGNVTLVAGGTLCAKDGTLYRYRIPKSVGTRDDADVGASSPARYLAFLTATGSGTFRIYQGSP